MTPTNTTASSGTTGCLTSAGPSLDNSFGAAFIGLLFAAILFGVTNVQCLIYYQNSSCDAKFLKWTVAFLWSLDVLHLALISHTLYFYLVTNFTNVAIITVPTWSFCLNVCVTVSNNLVVRLFYARRVWFLSKKNWFPTIGAITLAVVTFVPGIGCGIKLFFYDSTLQFTRISWLIYTSFGSAVVADAWFVGSLCYFLAKNRTGFRTTDMTVNTIILYVINTGMLTSVCTIACFVSFATMPHNYIYIGIFFSLSKLYLNALLATLNARERLREGMSTTGAGVSSYQMPRIVRVGASSNTKHAMASFGTVKDVPDSRTQTGFDLGDKESPGLAISVRTETDFYSDETDAKPSHRAAAVIPV